MAISSDACKKSLQILSFYKITEKDADTDKLCVGRVGRVFVTVATGSSATIVFVIWQLKSDKRYDHVGCLKVAWRSFLLCKNVSTKVEW